MLSNHPTSAPLWQRILQDEESQICFGAALICLAGGLIGLALNMIIPLPTTLDALLVLSVFYGMCGIARASGLRRDSASLPLRQPESIAESVAQEKVRSAA